MKVITISGVDGSGKTTQVKMLEQALVERGEKVFYFHATMFSVANRNKKASPGSQKAVTKAGFFKVQLRKVALLLDLLRFELLLNKLKKEGYTVVVSDRYFYDTVINIMYLSSQGRNKILCAPLFMKLIRPADHAFYLDVKKDEIIRREREIEQGTDYLKDKIKLLDEFARTYGMSIIDGSETPGSVHVKILNHLPHD